MQKEFGVLELGSGNLRFATVKMSAKMQNMTLFKEISYSGFCDAELLEENHLAESFDTILKDFNKNLNLIVGIPAEFSGINNSNYKIEFAKPTKITDKVITNFLEKFKSQFLFDKYTVIDAKIIEFLVDGKKITNPIGTMQETISALITCVYVTTSFLSTIKTILNGLDIYNIKYVLTPLATNLAFLTQQERENGAIIIDVGFTTTSVAFSCGDGLLNLTSFSLGSAHITAEIGEHLHLNYNEAESLKKKVLLNIDPSEVDYYETENKGNYLAIPARQVNRIVKAKIEQIGKIIKKCLTNFDLDQDIEYPIYLTGGICYIKGALDTLNYVVGKDMEQITSNQINLDRPSLSALDGLIKYGVNDINKSKDNIFKKIWAKFA